jgi:hypothetical protein
VEGLLVEETGLGTACGSGDGLAAGDADYSKHSNFREGCPGNKDTVGRGVEVRGGDLEAIVEEREQIVGNDAFEGFSIGVTQLYPQTVELWAAKKSLTFGFEIVGKLPYEIDGAHSGQWNFQVFTFGCQEIDGVGLAEACGVQIAAHRLLVEEHNDDFLVRRGWGSSFQNGAFFRSGLAKFANRQNVCYVKRVFPVKLLFSLGLGPRSTAL